MRRQGGEPVADSAEDGDFSDFLGLSGLYELRFAAEGRQAVRGD